MANIKVHGIELAQNSNIKNLVAEGLASDPVVTEAGRVWFNSSEKLFKGTFLDGSNNVVIKSFSTGGDLTSFITNIASQDPAQGTNLIGYDGHTGANGLFSLPASKVNTALDSIVTGVDANAQALADLGTGTLTDLQTEIDLIETGAGLDATGAFVPFSGTNFLDTATTLANAESLLDTALKAEETARTNADGQIITDLADVATGKGASLIGLEDAADNFTATNVEAALAEISASVGAVDFQSVYDASDVAGDAAINLATGKAFVINDDNDATYFRIDPDGANPVKVTMSGAVAVTGDMHVSGELLVDGAVTEITSTVTSADHMLLKPASSTFAVQINPEASYAPGDLVDIKFTNNGTSAIRVDSLNTLVEIYGLKTTGSATFDGGFTVGAGQTVDLGANKLTNAIDGVADTDVATVGQLNAAVAASDTQAELDTTQASAGLDTDGNYVTPTGTNFLDATTTLAGADSTLDTALGTVITGVGLGADGTYTAPVGTNYIDSSTSFSSADTLLDTQVKSVQDELDASQTGAGLSAAGAYVVPTGTNFLDATTSLANATIALDTALAAAGTDTATIKTAVGLDTDGTYIQPTTTNYLNSSTSVMNALTALDGQSKVNADAITQEVSDRQDAITTLKSALNGKQYTITTAAAALTHTINHALDSQYVNYTILVEGDDGKYRNDIVAVTETDNNNLTVELTESRKVKAVVTKIADLT